MNRVSRWQLLVSATMLTGSCATGSDAPVAPILAKVVLTPKYVTVLQNGEQQFSAVGLLSDGRIVAVAVRYHAERGSITTQGLYTAASEPGTSRVIATLSGGAFADTAVVATPRHGIRSYSTSFPSTESPVSENGLWINGGTAGVDWTNVSTSHGLAIGHQIGASYTDATALLDGTWGPDQFVAATVHSVRQKDQCSQEVELRLRSAIAPHINSGYEVGFKASRSPDAYLIIVRWNGELGDFTYLFQERGAKYGVTHGDEVSASVVGNAITAYRNGVELARATDMAYTTGSPGMGFNLENSPAGCAGTNGDYGITRFIATDVPSDPPTTGPSAPR